MISLLIIIGIYLIILYILNIVLVNKNSQKIEYGAQFKTEYFEPRFKVDRYSSIDLLGN